jgi:hypothetical protein
MSLNVLKPSLVKGFLNTTGSTVIRSAAIDTESTAGVAVKLDSYSNGSVVTPVTVTTDKIYGFVPYTAKRTTFTADSDVRVVLANAVIVMEAAAAIAVGAQLEYVVTGNKVQTKSTGTLIGTALQVASEAGDLIKVEVKIGA